MPRSPTGRSRMARRLFPCLSLALAPPVAAAEPVTAQPDVAAFQRLEGVWACKGTLQPGAIGPGSPAGSYEATATIHPVFGGHAYRLAFDHKASAIQPRPFSGAWHGSWDGLREEFVFFWVDNVGTIARQTSPGWQGDTLAMSGEGTTRLPAPGGGQTTSFMQFRDSFTITAPDIYHWKGEMKLPGGPWRPLGEDICTRTGPAPGSD